MSSLKIKLGLSNGPTVGKFGIPGGGVDSVAPSVTSFSATTPSTSLNIPITSFTADEAGVQFLITESSTPPSAGAAGWTSSAPTTYTVSSNGGYTLYPWVKDASGNVSSVYGSPVTVSVTVYLLRDLFTTDVATVTFPRNCEPTGVLSGTDPSGTFSVTGGKLVASSTTALGVPRFYGGSQARVSGKVSMLKINFNGGANGIWGWHTATNDYPQKGAFQKNGTALQLIPGAVVGAITTGVEYQTAVVLRSTGAFFLIKGGSFSEWTLLYVNRSLTDATIFAGYGAVAGAYNVDNLTEYQLPAPWTTDFGIADFYNASASAGDTASAGAANACVESTWTAVTNETYELSVRRTDDNNRWIVRGSQSGSTLKLIKVEAGVETEVASAATAFSNGVAYRHFVVCDGNTIMVFGGADAFRYINYTSASFNNTAVGIKTSHAVANFAAFPRVLSGTALTELSRPS